MICGLSSLIEIFFVVFIGVLDRDNKSDYTQRAQEAEKFGDKGLAVQLEDMVRDESGHTEETERILRDWPL